MADTKKLIIIDANSLIHRAYHALPPFTSKNGEPVGAVYGFLSIFFKALKELQPDFIALVFDMAQPTFRHKAFADYKAQRPKAPDDFYQQIPKIKEIIRLFGLTVFEKEGFEADDVIGTIAALAESPDLETVILSSDKDILQLVDDTTKALLLRRGITETVLYDEATIRSTYQGLMPRQLIDFKALKGDPSDNIPGVLGVGEKTALDLISRFASLDNLYQALEEGKADVKESLRQRLIDQKEKAFLSRQLSEIDRKTEIDFSLEACRWREYDRAAVSQALQAFHFFSLLKRLP